MSRSVLISGLGIAGPTLAFWLKRFGFAPTVVERAPAPRTGGYLIDFWGVGFEVAERMGLVPEMRRAGYGLEEVKFVDARGRRVSSLSAKSFALVMGDRYLSILRSDLARILYERIRDEVPVIFGDGIAAIAPADDHVSVSFEHGASRRFDLVVGADGLHSAVRRQAFGASGDAERFCGYYAAAFTVEDHATADPGAYVSHTVPGKQVARYRLRRNQTAAFFIFRAPAPLPLPAHDVDAQKRALRSVFADVGWEAPSLLARLDAATDFYFDAVSQVILPRWSRGRTALVGDAAFCPSLLAGEGAAIAMAGAYVLAGELLEAAGDHDAAFAAYERRFKAFASAKQAAARSFAGSFVPKTALGVWARNQACRVMSVPAVAKWYGERYLADHLALPDYGPR
jgi:2-polyprenyl-6-methoxyphenol hydroxylase-like FAD-dependent oxidoreductase